MDSTSHFRWPTTVHPPTQAIDSTPVSNLGDDGNAFRVKPVHEGTQPCAECLEFYCISSITYPQTLQKCWLEANLLKSHAFLLNEIGV
ncbi:unnamed protein product [Rodentolepis nana]|uniref:Apple domain-containing protein n=1 Tax=Rodentolepis nana TaxID=102285 RepID=A0A0R3TCA9_RODNA|nr:unnamed protein product [Rodentolepis nana]